jgi:hypothetical protein
MFFKKNKIICEKCKSSISEEYSYCPHCGNPMLDVEKEKKDFGILGRNDALDDETLNQVSDSNLGFMDKIMDSMMNSIMRSAEKEMKKAMKNPNMNMMPNMPNGIKIRIASPHQPQQQKKKANKIAISDAQIKRMSEMPKGTAKTNVRRLTDKVVYELSIPGISTPEDVFISKLETGYEIRAIGQKKVYINSLPVELPIKGFAFDKDKLFVEFKTQEE